MITRGIADYEGPDGTGIDAFLELAEAFGLLEKRPNTMCIGQTQRHGAVA
jgi:hypothetical protein